MYMCNFSSFVINNATFHYWFIQIKHLKCISKCRFWTLVCGVSETWLGFRTGIECWFSVTFNILLKWNLLEIKIAMQGSKLPNWRPKDCALLNYELFFGRILIDFLNCTLCNNGTPYILIIKPPKQICRQCQSRIYQN